jgi:hypothetical protein
MNSRVQSEKSDPGNPSPSPTSLSSTVVGSNYDIEACRPNLTRKNGIAKWYPYWKSSTPTEEVTDGVETEAQKRHLFKTQTSPTDIRKCNKNNTHRAPRR